jgi:hypothetical protein
MPMFFSNNNDIALFAFTNLTPVMLFLTSMMVLQKKLNGEI